MSWGKGITITIILFTGFILFLVITCVRQTDINLVSSDYYEQEIAYQQVINKMNNTTSLSAKPEIKTGADGTVWIDFSEMANYRSMSGDVLFFRPSDPKLDLRVHLSLDTNGRQEIAKGALQRGKWVCKINWQTEGKDYYIETPLIIQ